MTKEFSCTEMFTAPSGKYNAVFPQGSQTLHISLSGCNLKCSYCDVKKVKKVDSKINIFTVVDRITDEKPINILFTGGEPFLQQENILQILKEAIKEYPPMKAYGPSICFETNGTVHPSVALQEFFLRTKNIKAWGFSYNYKFGGSALGIRHLEHEGNSVRYVLTDLNQVDEMVNSYSEYFSNYGHFKFCIGAVNLEMYAEIEKRMKSPRYMSFGKTMLAHCVWDNSPWLF